MSKQKNPKIILASQSKWRAQILTKAGILFATQPANIDERQIEEPLLHAGLDGAEIASVLATSKALAIVPNQSGTLVIGSDQTLSLDGKLLHKATDMEEARRRLLLLSGKTHYLNSAVTIAQNGEPIWQYSETAAITMRNLSPKFIGQYLAGVGKQVLGSVGVYQIEGEGVQLFENIEGDFFTIMGLPLLPLIKQLRTLGFLDE